MLRLGAEEGVRNAQVMKGAQLQKSLSVFIHFAHCKLTKAGGPRVVICTHSGIEVTQKNNLFLAGNVPDDGCKVPVEHVLIG